MVDIFDEVDEELRAERAQAVLRRYAGVIIAAAVLIVGAAAGWQAWRWYQAKQDAAAAQQYMVAMHAANAAATDDARRQALAALQPVVAGAPDGYRTLARLRAAALKADSGDVAGAATLWTEVAADSGADPLLRQLASLLWATHQIDTADPALLESRLKPLTEPGNVWRPLAEEQLAVLDLRQGKPDPARTILTRLANDVTAPAGLRGRAAGLLARLGG